MRSGEADQWSTVLPTHTVLIVIRNLTSLSRLLDILPLLDSDKRLAVQFTVDEGSAFTAGLREQLERFDITPRQWSEVMKARFSLVLAAHVNPSLAELSGPLVVVPHGVGYNRRLQHRTGQWDTPVGLSWQEISVRGEVFPEVIGLSHERQRRHLTSAAARRAEVIGDPTWDRIRANLIRRASFRRELGVSAGQRLILVSSTWGRHSLLGRQGRLLERLLAQLPLDEYQIAFVLHPNIWAHHGIRTLRAWYRDALDSGLLLIRPEDNWQAVLIAADLSIGDHGSVAFYSAALGRPFLNATTGYEDLTAGSVIRRLMRVAPRLRSWRNLRRQVENTGSGNSLAQITGQALGRPGESLTLLRQVFYRLLKLDPPTGTPRIHPFRTPQPLRGNHITAFHVRAHRLGGEVRLERFPAILQGFRHRADTSEYLLVVLAEEVDPPTRANAEIIVHTELLPEHEATAWTERTLAEEQAGLVAARTEDGCLLAFRSPALGRISLRLRDPDATRVLAAAVAAHHLCHNGQHGIPTFTATLASHPPVVVTVWHREPLPGVETADEVAQTVA